MKKARQSSFISTISRQSTPLNRPDPVQLHLSSSMASGNVEGGFGISSDINGSAQKGSQLGRDAMFEEEGFLLQPDFEFDEEGNIIELTVHKTPQVEKTGSEIRGPSESAITGRVRGELEEGLLAGQEMVSTFQGICDETPTDFTPM